MPGAMFGAGRGAAYVALSSGPRDTPQRVLMTPTQRVFVPQLKSLPHTQQIPPPGLRSPRAESHQKRAECLWGSFTHKTPFLGCCEDPGMQRLSPWSGAVPSWASECGIPWAGDLRDFAPSAPWCPKAESTLRRCQVQPRGKVLLPASAEHSAHAVLTTLHPILGPSLNGLRWS